MRVRPAARVTLGAAIETALAPGFLDPALEARPVHVAALIPARARRWG